MNRRALPLLLLTALTATTTAPLQGKGTVPRMPSPQFAPSVVNGGGLTFHQIREQLETILPAGTKLELGGTLNAWTASHLADRWLPSSYNYWFDGYDWLQHTKN